MLVQTDSSPTLAIRFGMRREAQECAVVKNNSVNIIVRILESQIMACIGEIEALVAQREIRYPVLPYGDSQTLPIVK
jgi:hypothetical protein